jgi:hypothetical protein
MMSVLDSKKTYQREHNVRSLPIRDSKNANVGITLAQGTWRGR